MDKNEKFIKRKISRRTFLKTSGSIAAGVSAGGLLGASFPKKVFAQSPSGTINVVIAGDADSYDPHVWISDDGKMCGLHVFETLVSQDGKPMLATSWEVPDKNTWIFHLKKDIGFSNGEAFDASVVKFNLDRFRDPKTKAPRIAQLKPLESIEALDKHTVKIKTKTPYAILAYILKSIPMLSPAGTREKGDDISRKLIGTGPFVFKKWIPSERTVIEANPDYYGAKANVKTIIWRPVSEASTRIVELKSGRADIIDKVPNELVGELSGKGIKAIRVPSLFRHSVFLNCGKPPFDNVKVRMALGLAINMEEIVKYVLRGAGSIMGDPCEGWPCFDPTVKPRSHDPARAKELLAEAGYPNGIECKIVTPAGRYLKDKEVMEAIAFQVKEAGINMEVEPCEWGMFLKKFKTADGYFVGGYSPPHSLFGPGFNSRTKHILWFGYHNENYNKLIDEQAETFDETERNAIYSRMSHTILKDVPTLFLYLAQHIYGVNDRLKGFTPRRDGLIFLRNASII